MPNVHTFSFTILLVVISLTAFILNEDWLMGAVDMMVILLMITVPLSLCCVLTEVIITRYIKIDVKMLDTNVQHSENQSLNRAISKSLGVNDLDRYKDIKDHMSEISLISRILVYGWTVSIIFIGLNIEMFMTDLNISSKYMYGMFLLFGLIPLLFNLTFPLLTFTNIYSILRYNSCKNHTENHDLWNKEKLVTNLSGKKTISIKLIKSRNICLGSVRYTELCVLYNDKEENFYCCLPYSWRRWKRGHQYSITTNGLWIDEVSYIGK